jgi:hypothetical protein
MDLNNIIQEFVDKYSLNKGQVVAEIEKTFSSMLSRWHRQNIVAIYTTEGLSAVAYLSSAIGPEQIPIDISSAMRGQNTLRRILDKNLSKAASCDEVARYKKQEGEMVWGDVIGRNEAHLDVELQMEFGVKLLATCPLQYIGKHERDFILKGDRKAFHLRRVETISMGDVSRTHIIVDRVSKALVERLLVSELRSNINNIRLTCTRRFAGRKSFVETNSFIPKNTILKASRELDEHIQVTLRKNRRKEHCVKTEK